MYHTLKGLQSKWSRYGGKNGFVGAVFKEAGAKQWDHMQDLARNFLCGNISGYYISWMMTDPIGGPFTLIISQLFAGVILAYAIPVLGLFWGTIWIAMTIAGEFYFAQAAGLLESSRNLHIVRMNQIHFTLPKAHIDEIRLEEQRMPYNYEATAAHNKRRGMLEFMNKVQPICSTRVLADPARPDARFWALDNVRVIRSSLLGYYRMKVKIVSPESVNGIVSSDLARWQAIRVRAAQSPANVRSVVTKNLRSYHVEFAYPSDSRNMLGEFVDRHLEVRFHRSEASPRHGDRGKKHTPEKWLYIDNLESMFESWVEKSKALVGSQGAQRDCGSELQENCKILVKSLKAGVNPAAEEPADVDDDNEGLCVCCLDAEAEMVMRACGHLVFCADCRRRAVGQAKGILSYKGIQPRQLETTGVSCPICRKTSYMVRKSSFTARIYKQ